jgi:hypothetical protein
MQHYTSVLNRESGVSEVIGATMLIMVVVTAIAVIGAVILSQPPPQKIPALDAIISNTGRTIQIYHNGGDMLQYGEMTILVDGKETVFKKGTDSSWQSWSSGESLYNYSINPEMAKTVRIFYKGTGSATLLASADLGPSGMPVTTYRITTSAGAGGTISPPGPVSVEYGDNSPAFTITPVMGYHIVDVLVDGSSVGAVATYTFPSVTSSHTISATFAINTYTITASAGANGAINPSGSVSVNYGDTPTFTFTPSIGYHIADVIVDTVSQGTIPSYQFPSVTSDHTISVTFAINTYTITPVVSGGGGTIAPSTPQTVNYGSTPTFTFTRNIRYHLDIVTVDGNPVIVIGNSYTFPPVTANHVIQATFAANTRADIFYDDFESLRPSANGWTETGSVDWGVYIPTNGVRDVRFRGGAPAESITRTISTAANSSIIVSFQWAGSSLESGEYVRAEYSTNGGTSWTTLSQITGPIGTITTFTSYTSTTLPASADYNPSFVLRFIISANSNTNDYAYIDDVRVTGIPD